MPRSHKPRVTSGLSKRISDSSQVEAPVGSKSFATGLKSNYFDLDALCAAPFSVKIRLCCSESSLIDDLHFNCFKV